MYALFDSHTLFHSTVLAQWHDVVKNGPEHAQVFSQLASNTEL